MPTPRELVAALGIHPSAALGLDLEDERDLWRWLLASCLLTAPEERARAAFRALLSADLADVATLAGAPVARVAERLATAGLPRPERAAATLVRAARALSERHAGSLSKLLRQADDLAAAGEALCALAPGIGRSTALRFLRPLRERVPGGADTPLAAAAFAAAACLLWIAPDADPETAAASLAQRLRDEPAGPALRDVEAALERLGMAACAKRRPLRCPLALACPLRYRQEP